MSCARSTFTGLGRNAGPLVQQSLLSSRWAATPASTVRAWRTTPAPSAPRLCSAARTFSTRGALNAKATGKGTRSGTPDGSAAAQTPPPPTRPPTLRARRVQPPPPAPEPPANKYMDPKGKDYKRASRSYTGLVVGLPFLIVTSIYLYKRAMSEEGLQLPGGISVVEVPRSSSR